MTSTIIYQIIDVITANDTTATETNQTRNGSDTKYIVDFEYSSIRHIDNVGDVAQTIVSASSTGTELLTTDDVITTTGGIQDGTDDAIPLWLPYVAITIVMLFLIVVSFARFHVVRGYQYRKRHGGGSDADSLSKGSSLTSFRVTDSVNGSAANACRSGAVAGMSTTTPDYLTMFLEFSRLDDDDGISPGNGKRQRRPLRRDNRMYSVDFTTSAVSTGDGVSSGNAMAARRPKRTLSADLQRPLAPESKKLTGNGKGGVGTGGNTKRPLAFTFNINGSMVDVRCSDDERTNTFRLPSSVGGGNTNSVDYGGLQTTSTTTAALNDDDSVVIVVTADDYDVNGCDFVTNPQMDDVSRRYGYDRRNFMSPKIVAPDCEQFHNNFRYIGHSPHAHASAEGASSTAAELLRYSPAGDILARPSPSIAEYRTHRIDH